VSSVRRGRKCQAYLDDDGGIIGWQAVSEHALDKEAHSLEVRKELVRLGEVYPGQAEELGLGCQYGGLRWVHPSRD
jgi:hypothetical protein